MGIFQPAMLIYQRVLIYSKHLDHRTPNPQNSCSHQACRDFILGVLFQVELVTEKAIQLLQGFSLLPLLVLNLIIPDVLMYIFIPEAL